MIPSRSELLKKAASTELWDIIVIGGGATGLGKALDAASRGYSTLLLEAHDFGKGTSSKSTKLIHGGVRYLRQGNVKMVMKALRERGRLLKNAPHIVGPLQFVVPCYKWWHKLWHGIGMKVYDALARSLGIAPSRWLDFDSTISLLPGITKAGLRGGVSYWDGQFDDARLLISLAQTTVLNRGIPLNYMKVVGLTTFNGRTTGVEAIDQESGTAYSFEGKVVINATGAFTDQIRHMDQPSAKGIMQAAQGIHLVLDASFLSEKTAVMVPGTDDGRVIFGVPWHGKVLLGTTDTPRDTVSLEPKALEEEIDYLLDHAGRYFSMKPRRSDVLSVYAGLRPLVKANKETKAISRDHTIEVSKTGLVTITGGKWTTYRQMGEDAVNRAEKVAGFARRKCLTRNMALFDGSTLRDEESQEPDLPLEGFPYSTADIERAIQFEWPVSLEDMMARRTRCLLLNAAHSKLASLKIAEQMARAFHWTDEKKQTEIEQYAELVSMYEVTKDV